MPGKDKTKKIIKAGDANVPNAANIMKKKGLGPAMFPIKKAKGQILGPEEIYSA